MITPVAVFLAFWHVVPYVLAFGAGVCMLVIVFAAVYLLFLLTIATIQATWAALTK